MKRQRGVTLAELVVSIVVIATAGAALVGTLSYLSGSGAEHMLQSQAQSIADAYLNEITGKCFADCEPGPENNRAQFDSVTDYQGLDTNVASDEQGNVAGNFRVRVTLTPGTYLLTCYVPDAGDQKPHVAHGMLQEVVIN